jgi:hypothetical protein
VSCATSHAVAAIGVTIWICPKPTSPESLMLAGSWPSSRCSLKKAMWLARATCAGVGPSRAGSVAASVAYTSASSGPQSIHTPGYPAFDEHRHIGLRQLAGIAGKHGDRSIARRCGEVRIGRQGKRGVGQGRDSGSTCGQRQHLATRQRSLLLIGR